MLNETLRRRNSLVVTLVILLIIDLRISCQSAAAQEIKSTQEKLDSISSLMASSESHRVSLDPSGAANIMPDLFSGALTTSLPIEVPRGRSGLQPTLSLQYRSTAENGILGVGWDLEIGAIERSTKKWALTTIPMSMFTKLLAEQSISYL